MAPPMRSMRRSLTIQGRGPRRGASVRLQILLNAMRPTATPAQRIVRFAGFRGGDFLFSAPSVQGFSRLKPQTSFSLGCPARQEVPPKCFRNLRRIPLPTDGPMEGTLRGSCGHFSGYASFAVAPDTGRQNRRRPTDLRRARRKDFGRPSHIPA